MTWQKVAFKKSKKLSEKHKRECVLSEKCRKRMPEYSENGSKESHIINMFNIHELK